MNFEMLPMKINTESKVAVPHNVIASDGLKWQWNVNCRLL